MKVFLVIALMMAGESEPTRLSTEMPNLRECFEVAWKFVNGPLPQDFVLMSTTCEVRMGTPS